MKKEKPPKLYIAYRLRCGKKVLCKVNSVSLGDKHQIPPKKYLSERPAVYLANPILSLVQFLK